MIKILALSMLLIVVGLLMFPYLMSIWEPFATNFLNTQTVDPLVAIFTISVPFILIVAFIIGSIFNPRV